MSKKDKKQKASQNEETSEEIFHIEENFKIDPQRLASQLLGITSEEGFRTSFLDIGHKDFEFISYGVHLKFRKDGDRFKVLVGKKTRRICISTAYWLADKLARETNRETFYTPNREGIIR